VKRTVNVTPEVTVSLGSTCPLVSRLMHPVTTHERTKKKLAAATTYCQLESRSIHLFTIVIMSAICFGVAWQTQATTCLRRDSVPSNLTGANGFSGQDHCSRACGAEHRHTAGAPLKRREESSYSSGLRNSRAAKLVGVR